MVHILVLFLQYIDVEPSAICDAMFLILVTSSPELPYVSSTRQPFVRMFIVVVANRLGLVIPYCSRSACRMRQVILASSVSITKGSAARFVDYSTAQKYQSPCTLPSHVRSVDNVYCDVLPRQSCRYRLDITSRMRISDRSG